MMQMLRFTPEYENDKIMLLQTLCIEDDIQHYPFIITGVKLAPAEIMGFVKESQAIKLSFYRLDTSNTLG